MAPDGSDGGSTLVERGETRVRDLTRGRVRGLVVEERDGRVFVSGQVSSRHIKHSVLLYRAAIQIQTVWCGELMKSSRNFSKISG